MNKLHKSFLIGVTALGFGIGAVSAQAQQATPPAPSQTGASSANAGHGKHHDGKFRERMAQRAAELHDKLKLTSSQEPAWQSFIAAMKPQEKMGQRMGQRPDRAEWAKLSAPERMEKMLDRMKQHEARMTDRLAAVKTFYAVLTPEQQKVFNDSFGKGFGHRHGGKHGDQSQR